MPYSIARARLLSQLPESSWSHCWNRGPTHLAVLTVATLIGLASLTQAAVIVSDNFDYPDGPLAGQNGGTGFSNAWQSTSLDVSSGIAIGNSDSRRDFTANPFGSSGTRWVSFDWGFASRPADDGSFGGLTFYISGTETFMIGNTWPTVGHDKWGMSGSGLSAVDNYPMMKTGVAKITLGVGATSMVELWVGPTGALVDVSGPALLTTTNATMAGVDGIRIGGSTFGAGVNQSFGNLVIGTEMTDVAAVPEPSTALLGGLGLIVAILARRASRTGFARAKGKVANF